LWARRLLGEALTQARRVGFEHAFLGGLIGADQEQSRELVRQLTAEIAANHSRRMTQLGLAG
jgi:hypothetical protein